MNELLPLIERQQAGRSLLVDGAIAACGLLLVAFVDLATGTEISLSLFYLGPISLFVWRVGIVGGLAASVIGSVIWYLVDEAGGHVYGHPLIPIWNTLVRLSFFAIVSLLLDSLRRSLQREGALARTDSLTGLLNRRAFEEIAEREIARAARINGPLTVGYIDLDGFKRVNDRHGHAAGDRLLQAVADVLKNSVRSVDVTARLGGDEFGVLMPDTDRAAATGAIVRLGEQLASAAAPSSIGTVVFESAPADVAAALAAVDEAMYAAKADHRSQVVVRVVGTQVGTGLDPSSKSVGAIEDASVEETVEPHITVDLVAYTDSELTKVRDQPI